MDLVHIIDALAGIVLMGLAYFLSTQARELKRVEILLNRTREDYATKSELQSETKEIKELILRLEVKLDRFIEKNNG